ncbi:MAG: hypothetical protein KatS3mg087_1361 [Patescibacteria group bacterium]|nr:MAG: hypothetical protein KatS3mg087_1361 [Patescibacteria group bacterium]
MTFVRPGESVRRHLTARWYNNTVRKQHKTEPLHLNNELNPIYVTAYVNSLYMLNENPDAGDPVYVYPEYNYSEEQTAGDFGKNTGWVASGHATGIGYLLGVLLEKPVPNETARVQLSGKAQIRIKDKPLGYNRTSYVTIKNKRFEFAETGYKVSIINGPPEEYVTGYLVLPVQGAAKELGFGSARLTNKFEDGVGRCNIVEDSSGLGLYIYGEYNAYDPLDIFIDLEPGDYFLYIYTNDKIFPIQAIPEGRDCCTGGNGPIVNSGVIIP